MIDEQVYYDRALSNALNASIPARTETYSPVGNGAIIDAIKEKLRLTEMKVLKTRIHSNIFGTRVTGFFDVEDIRPRENPHGLNMMLGFRNSYDKSMSIAFVAGASVWICSNGLISGDLISYRRKHTGEVATELGEKIDIGIERMRSDFGRLNMEVDILKDFSLTRRQKSEILGVMYFEKNLMTSTQLTIVKRELTESKHFKEDNAWSLYNNITESLKRSHPADVIQSHIKVHDFFKDVTGMNEPTPETEDVQPENQS